MPEGVSARAFARLVGVSDTAIRKAVKTGRLKALSDGTIDPVAGERQWKAAADPARGKPREPANSRVAPTIVAVRSEDEARAAVHLIARVLQEEGAESAGTIDFGMARTAETILKARERDLKIAERRKELVPLALVKGHIEKAFVGYRQAVQRLPSRFAAQMAADVGCEAGALDAALSKVIATVLDELSAPVVRA